MEINILDNLRMAKQMEKESMYLLMEERVMENTRMVNNKVSIYLHLKMASKKNKYGKMENALVKRKLNEILCFYIF